MLNVNQYPLCDNSLLLVAKFSINHKNHTLGLKEQYQETQRWVKKR